MPGLYSCLPIEPQLLEGQHASAQAGLNGTGESRDIQTENSNSHEAIQLCNEAEALELVKFDLHVNSKDIWDPPKLMMSIYIDTKGQHENDKSYL